MAEIFDSSHHQAGSYYHLNFRQWGFLQNLLSVSLRSSSLFPKTTLPVHADPLDPPLWNHPLLILVSSCSLRSFSLLPPLCSLRSTSLLPQILLSFSSALSLIYLHSSSLFDPYFLSVPSDPPLCSLHTYLFFQVLLSVPQMLLSVPSIFPLCD